MKGPYQTHNAEVRRVYSRSLTLMSKRDLRDRDLQIAIIINRKAVNRDFLIRLTSQSFRDQILGRLPKSIEVSLVSAGQYDKVVGLELANKHFTRVLTGGQDRYTFQLRRGLKVEFITR